MVCLWTSLSLAHASQSSPLPDFDENGVLDLPDFLLFVEHFGTSRGDEKYEDRFDLNGDGAIAFSDFLIFASNFGKTVPQAIDTKINFPLRAIHAAGNWGDTGYVVDQWEAAGRIGTAHTYGLYPMAKEPAYKLDRPIRRAALRRQHGQHGRARVLIKCRYSHFFR